MPPSAAVHHCKTAELEASHEHHRLTALLKDADALDRVRISGGLDPRFLGHKEAGEMLDFAQVLFDESSGRLAPGPGHFEKLWPMALALSSRVPS